MTELVSDAQLSQIMPTCPAARRAELLGFMQQAMVEFDIVSYLRQAAFVAQLAVESGELKWMEELASGKKYEGRIDLGNTQPGDGPRFKGRGPIQLTGRNNYALYGTLLGLDLVNNPTIAATPAVGFRIAGLYWKRNGLNELADAQRIKRITKKINGGYNGLKQREKYYQVALQVLHQNGAGVAHAPSKKVGKFVQAMLNIIRAHQPGPPIQIRVDGDLLSNQSIAALVEFQNLYNTTFHAHLPVNGKADEATCAAIGNTVRALDDKP